MKILLVEDEVNLGETLKEYLQRKNFATVWVTTCKQALETQRTEIFDLCLLDIGLPDGDGLQLAQELKKKQEDLPFLFLSAQNDPEIRVQGLELGAEDYITKPFDLRELQLRLERILSYRDRRAALPKEARHGKLTIWFKGHKVQDSAGKIHQLNQKECAILALLYKHQNQVVSRDRIIDEVWGQDSFPSQRTVDNYIVNLRRWSDTDPKALQISTIRGIGYCLEIKG